MGNMRADVVLSQLSPSINGPTSFPRRAQKFSDRKAKIPYIWWRISGKQLPDLHAERDEYTAATVKCELFLVMAGQ